MIGVGDLYRIASRTGQYGTPASSPGWASSTPAQDILDAINVRLIRVWAAANWRWRHEDLAIPLIANQDVYEVASSSGNPIDRIISLYPVDKTKTPTRRGRPMVEMTERDFLSKDYPRSDFCSGAPSKYWNYGMNSNNVWRIQLAPIPRASVPYIIGGSAKMVLNPTPAALSAGAILFALADITANTSIPYFPNGVVVDCVLTGVLSDIAGCKGDTAGQSAKDAMFERKIVTLMGEQLGVATDDTPVTSEPPDMVKHRGGYPGWRRGMYTD